MLYFTIIYRLLCTYIVVLSTNHVCYIVLVTGSMSTPVFYIIEGNVCTGHKEYNEEVATWKYTTRFTLP